MSRIIWLRSMSVRILEKRGDQTEYTEDDGQTWTVIPEGSLVSMNMWGVFCKYSERTERTIFRYSCKKNLSVNPMKCEYFLPEVVSNLLSERKSNGRSS